MRRRSSFHCGIAGIVTLALMVLMGRSALATDWFVAPSEKAGDGTRQKPFHDPYVALRAAEPGDVIHVAAGVYHGRYERGFWEVDRPRITLRGGYSPDFSRRTPWETPSVFALLPSHEAVRESSLMIGKDDHSGLVLDGFAFDAGARNGYGEDPQSGLTSVPSMDGVIAAFSSPNVVIQNCLFANSANAGVELSGEGSRFENNVIVNTLGIGMLILRDNNGGHKLPITVKSNTFAFANELGDPPLGKGADNGIGVRVHCPAVIQDNVFLACANFAITLFVQPERVSVDRNVFWMSTHDTVAKRMAGEQAEITEKNMDEIEDLGLKSAAGNAVQDPGLSNIKPEWFDVVSRYLLSAYAQPPTEAVAAMRSQMGLPAFTPSKDAGSPKKDESTAAKDPKAGGKPAADTTNGALSPRLAVADALAMRVKSAQGARPAELKVEIKAEPAATASYRP